MVTLALLLAIATLTDRTRAVCGVYFALLVVVTIAARLPVAATLLRAAAVLPFALTFALVSAIAGEPARAAMLIVRGYLSAFAALLLISTTPMPDLIAGLEWLHFPAFLLQVMQFLYRYLNVLMIEAASMRQASLARGTDSYIAIPSGSGRGGSPVCASLGPGAGDSSGDDLAGIRRTHACVCAPAVRPGGCRVCRMRGGGDCRASGRSAMSLIVEVRNLSYRLAERHRVWGGGRLHLGSWAAQA